MNAFYTREGSDGKWLALKEPPSGFRKPPTCPTCRTALDYTTPRYGRAFKCADLGILERNVASRMIRQLQAINLAVTKIDRTALDKALATSGKDATLLTSWSKDKIQRGRDKQRQAALQENRILPLDFKMLNVDDPKIHGAPPSDVRVWKNAARPFLEAYRQALDVAKTRSAHVHAWEAAFSYLYRHEMDVAVDDPAHAPRRPDEHAERTARMLVGQPKPLADQRYKVQAFWTTIRTRFSLAQLAQTWLNAVHIKAGNINEQCSVWSEYISFLLNSALQDIHIALKIARQSGSRKQITETALLEIEADMKKFSFNVFMARMTGTMAERREELLELAEEERSRTARYITNAVNEHLTNNKIDRASEELWLQENFVGPAQSIVEEWQAVKQSIRGGTFYQPVSREDLLQVIKALDFSKHVLHVGSLEFA